MASAVHGRHRQGDELRDPLRPVSHQHEQLRPPGRQVIHDLAERLREHGGDPVVERELELDRVHADGAGHDQLVVLGEDLLEQLAVDPAVEIDLIVSEGCPSERFSLRSPNLSQTLASWYSSFPSQLAIVWSRGIWLRASTTDAIPSSTGAFTLTKVCTCPVMKRAATRRARVSTNPEHYRKVFNDALGVEVSVPASWPPPAP